MPDSTPPTTRRRVRLTEANARYTDCKLGTKSTSIWIHKADFPLEKGDVIAYARREGGTATLGRVIADLVERYLFVGVDEHTPLLED